VRRKGQIAYRISEKGRAWHEAADQTELWRFADEETAERQAVIDRGEAPMGVIFTERGEETRGLRFERDGQILVVADPDILRPGSMPAAVPTDLVLGGSEMIAEGHRGVLTT
jgi:hypothetical protein